MVRGTHVRQETADAIADGLKAAPPVSVVGVTIAGMTLQDWVYTVTLIYTVLLITQHVWSKWIKPWREARRER